MTNLLRDTRFGFRLLRKNSSFATVAVLAIALGIGANTAIFSVVYATLLAPLPYPFPNQLVVVWSKVKGNKNGSWTGNARTPYSKPSGRTAAQTSISPPANGRNKSLAAS